MASVLDPASPAEQQGPPGKLLVLHIRAFQDNGRWCAECLDLNLMARRPDLATALHALFEQVQLYLEIASESGQWDERVPRPARTSHWISYYWIAFTQEIQRFLSRTRSQATFRMPVDWRGRLIGA
ncbi:MAG: hypothetical protein HYY04_12450 [Chloroflexi bacterium]|nr:hypothetical protein [Chloroflexota bacterium]